MTRLNNECDHSNTMGLHGQVVCVWCSAVVRKMTPEERAADPTFNSVVDPKSRDAVRRVTRRYHTDGTLPDYPAVFVFGSNMIGAHAGGAAKVAAELFGAEIGVGFGRTNNAFAIPTCDALGVPRLMKSITADVLAFLTYAERNPELFFVTRIGCGIAGFTDRQIAPLFKNAPSNCSLPDTWKEWVE